MSYSKFGPLTKPAVLVSDNSLYVRTFVRSALQQMGLAVTDAGIHHGLKIVQGKLVRFDLIITNQPQLFLRFKIPILYMASGPDISVSKLCVRTIQKPFNRVAISSAVAECLNLQQNPSGPELRIPEVLQDRLATTCSPNRPFLKSLNCLELKGPAREHPSPGIAIRVHILMPQAKPEE